jgi:hypothetical protein
MRHFSMNAASLIESARVGADSLRTNPTRTTLSTTGVIIGVAALVAAFSITDGVDLWARALIARESSVQDVSITPRTSTVVAGRTIPLSGYPVLTAEDAERAKSEVPGVAQYALTLTGSAPVEYLDRRATALLTLSTASLADFTTLEVLGGRFFTLSTGDRARSSVGGGTGGRARRTVAHRPSHQGQRASTRSRGSSCTSSNRAGAGSRGIRSNPRWRITPRPDV